MNQEAETTEVAVPAFDLTEQQRADIETTKFRIEAEVSKLDGITIQNNEDCEAVTVLQKKFRAFRLDADKIIAPVKRAINDKRNEILGVEKAICKVAESAEKRCGDMAGAYRVRLQQEQRELERLAREEQERERQAEIEEQAEEVAESEGEQAADAYRQEAYNAPVVEPTDVAQIAPKIEDTSVRKYYSAEVVDASKVPEKYKTIDLTKINAEARSFKDDFAIPGCRLIVRASQSASVNKTKPTV